MNLKNQNSRQGFMLTEILITIAIIGIALTPIFILQSSSLRSLYNYSERIRLLFPVKNFLQENIIEASNKEEQEISEEKQIKNPSATLNYHLKKVQDGSSLSKINDLYLGSVSIQSIRGTKESMVGFVYKPERKQQ